MRSASPILNLWLRKRDRCLKLGEMSFTREAFAAWLADERVAKRVRGLDEARGLLYSVKDTLRKIMQCREGPSAERQALLRAKQRLPDLAGRLHYDRQGSTTSTFADAETLFYVVGTMAGKEAKAFRDGFRDCLLYTSPSPRD